MVKLQSSDFKLLYIFAFSFNILILLLFSGSFLWWYGSLSFLFLEGIAYLGRLQKKGSSGIALWEVGWVSYMMLTAFSLFYTISIPLTVQQWSFMLFSFLHFQHVSRLNKKKIPLGVIIEGILFVSLILIGISTFFLFFPHARSLLPEVNFISPTFGHSHLSAILVLVFPLSLGLWMSKDQIGGFLSTAQRQAFSLLIALFIPLTFSRKALLIVCIQLGVLSAILFFQKRVSARLRRFLFAFLLFEGMFLFLSIVLFLYQIIFEPIGCFAGEAFSSQLCKIHSLSSRLLYFDQALSAWRDRFWLGWGGGTFSLLSERYAQHPESVSKFAHNSYLQTAAELGLPGVLLGGGMLIAFGLCIKKWSKDPNKMIFFFMLSIIGFLINSLGDFDFHILGFLVVLHILMGLFSVPYSYSSLSQRVGIVVRFLFWCTWLLLVALFIGVDVLLRFGKQELAFRSFPYFFEHSFIYAEQSQLLSPRSFNNFLGLYRSHRDILLTLSNVHPTDKCQWSERLNLSGNWSYLYGSVLECFAIQGKWHGVLETLKKDTKARADIALNPYFSYESGDQITFLVESFLPGLVQSRQWETFILVMPELENRKPERQTYLFDQLKTLLDRASWREFILARSSSEESHNKVAGNFTVYSTLPVSPENMIDNERLLQKASSFGITGEYDLQERIASVSESLILWNLQHGRVSEAQLVALRWEEFVFATDREYPVLQYRLAESLRLIAKEYSSIEAQTTAREIMRKAARIDPWDPEEE